MIVHFDRLKLCAPGTRYQVPSSPDIIPSTGPTRHVGDDTELFCDDEDDPLSSPSLPQAHPSSTRLVNELLLYTFLRGGGVMSVGVCIHVLLYNLEGVNYI